MATAGRFGDRPGFGIAFALLLLAAVEAALHTDALLVRYRSVFAAGRAMDKVRYIESRAPALLIVGNSRVDNGFAPDALAERMGVAARERIFNLGLPGSDARTLFGLLTRFDRKNLLGPGGIEAVVVGLDEDYLQPADALGYEVFFADRAAMLRHGEYGDLARSLIRLWGFSENLKELREPAKLERFVEASHASVEPIGGGSAQFGGYRAGFGGLQDAAQIGAQEAGSKNPPDPVRLDYLKQSIQLLRSRGVRLAFVYPPLLNRDVLYLSRSDPRAGPYLEIDRNLRDLGYPAIALESGLQRDPAEFINAGHLNDRGAKRFSQLLADELTLRWPDLPFRLSQ
jgi:hypothetical protein